MSWAHESVSSILTIPIALGGVTEELRSDTATAVVRTLAEVRDAAGHANVSITSAYLHVAVDDEGVGNLFGAM